MICQACGVEAPTKHVAFYRNIGLLVMRFTNSAEGHLCKSCIHKYFWQYTLTDLLLGWWGVISFIITPFLILNNIVRYLLCLGMDPVPPGAKQPVLTDEIIDRLKPYTEDLFERIRAGDALEQVVDSIAMRANVTPGQVTLYVFLLTQAAQNQQQ